MTDPLTPPPAAAPEPAAVPQPAVAPQPAAIPQPATLTFAPGLAPSNTAGVLGFVLAISGILVPVALLPLAGGIISIIGLRRAKFLATAGVPVTGRGLALAGVIVGFGLTVLSIIAFILIIAALNSLANQVSNINPGDFLDLQNQGDFGGLSGLGG